MSALVPDGVSGHVEPGYEAVAAAFADNLAQGREIGASFCAVRSGRVVVDLTGGWQDSQSQRHWTEHTLVTVFSGSKGLLALCLAILVDRAQLSTDRPVAAYWPRFAANGKREVLVADVLSHQARMPALHHPVTFDDMLDSQRMAQLLAAQEVEHAPGAALTYHPLTMGWICAELVRLVDGRELSQFFSDEISRPLGLDIYFGLPDELESRVAQLQEPPGWPGEPAKPSVDVADRWVRRLVEENPPAFARMGHWNESRVRGAVIPAAGAIASARSMAMLYGHLVANPAQFGGVLVADQTLRDFVAARSIGVDGLSGEPLCFGLGFQLPTSQGLLGPEPRAFGHGGIGGSIHGAWPDLGIGFSYAMNRLGVEHPDPRPAALLTALHRCAKSSTDGG